MKFDKIADTYSKRKEENHISEQLLENAKVIEEIIEIPLDKLQTYTDEDGSQPFEIDSSYVNALAKSINVNGQFDPIIVRPLLNGDYQILAGHHRYFALQKIVAETAKAKVVELSDWQAYCLLCETNIHHSGPLPSKLCKIFKRYRSNAKSNNEKLTAEKLANMYGISVEQMYRYIALDFLVEPLQRLVDTGYISSNSIKPLRVLNAEQQYVLADYVEFVGKKLNKSKCDKLITFLKDNPSPTRLEIDDFLNNTTKSNKKQNTNYAAIQKMNIQDLSSFLSDNIEQLAKLKYAENIEKFLNMELKTEN